jgi:hypothetical protein
VVAVCHPERGPGRATRTSAEAGTKVGRRDAADTVPGTNFTCGAA